MQEQIKYEQYASIKARIPRSNQFDSLSGCGAIEEADHSLRLLLCAGSKRPGGKRTAEKVSKLPPTHWLKSLLG